MYRMNQEQKQRSSLLFFSLLFLLLHHHQKVGSQRVKPSSRGQGELEKKNALKLLSQDVFIANPSGGLHKSEVPQKHAP